MSEGERAPRRYWRFIEERQPPSPFDATASNEFSVPVDGMGQLLDQAKFADALHSRRTFLKAAGFSVAGAMLASCARAPVEKVIPLLFKPE
ncbi:MAG: TAT-variant-translocated molybdopterin oxidoreductase, partial [Planctomycetes bacterium]|nr:TAT-variant-translocated molybdopterin oxidoreductase [Planctomycetota bacterium]